MKYTKIDNCRSCSEVELKSVFDLGDLSSCGYFPKQAGDEPAPTPLEILRCETCGLVQLAHDYELDALFRETYGYRSGLNASMVEHLGRLVGFARSKVDLASGDTVLDIGSNDGSLLAHYADVEGLKRVGVDPTIARFGHYYQEGITKIPDFFGLDVASSLGAGTARIVTSISMFYDLPDPNAFVASIRHVLAEDGVWVLEQSYLPLMIDRLSFDTICHEHLEYYSLDSIARIFARQGMRIADIAFNDVNGGSFCLAVVREENAMPSSPAVAKALAEEMEAGYGSAAPFDRFRSDVENLKLKVRAFFDKCKADGKTVHGYAASTKGNTTLQYFGITADDCAVIADVNPEKWGRFTPGTHIPIVSEADSKALKPDYYFVLAWHFRDDFVRREAEFVRNGGGLVFPLPKLEIVG